MSLWLILLIALGGVAVLWVLIAVLFALALCYSGAEAIKIIKAERKE